MSISDINGGFSHTHEDRYEVHEGDVIINRCGLICCISYFVDRIIKTIGAGISIFESVLTL